MMPIYVCMGDARYNGVKKHFENVCGFSTRDSKENADHMSMKHVAAWAQVLAG